MLCAHSTTHLLVSKGKLSVWSDTAQSIFLRLAVTSDALDRLPGILEACCCALLGSCCSDALPAASAVAGGACAVTPETGCTASTNDLMHDLRLATDAIN
jgi:hypothetical protein